MMRRLLLLAFCLAWPVATLADGEVKLNWEFKFGPDSTWPGKSCSGVPGYHYACHRDVANSIGAVRFVSARLDRNSLVFEMLAHNPSRDHYQCVYVIGGDDVTHMDDELANEYKGSTVVFADGLDNKLALNQRKRFQVRLPRPSEDVDLVNLHFGFHFVNIQSNEDCKPPVVNSLMNFHQLDWDLAPMRAAGG